MREKETLWIGLPDYDQFQTESLRLCALDIVVNQHYNNYALVFKTERDHDQPTIINTFCQALKSTLGQCNHIAGTIQSDRQGNFWIIVNAESAVPLVVQWLGADNGAHPSYDTLEATHFHGAGFGSPSLFTIPGMTMSSNASPAVSPAVAGFQLTFIRGGLIITACIHHFAMDVIGASGLIHHLAAHCHAIMHGTSPPTWAKNLVDRSRFISSPLSEVMQQDQQQHPPAPPNTQWMSCVSLLFHIPLTKIVELKALAMPSDGTWISTYDAISAFLWRVLLRYRVQIYGPDVGSRAVFAEPINMRNRVNPSVSRRYQGNLQCAGLSTEQRQQFTVADVISCAPLDQLASYIRKITNSTTEEAVQQTINMVSSARDKSTLHFRQDTMPPTSMVMTDWRDVDMTDADFGFGRPAALRQLADKVVKNLVIIYPRRIVEGDPDHGLEVAVPFEEQAIDLLVKDADMCKFFTFRGIDARDLT
ncbi:transferase [Xylaria arbuscula]|nr:transferase [Xylaria arbuscula]